MSKILSSAYKKHPKLIKELGKHSACSLVYYAVTSTIGALTTIAIAVSKLDPSSPFSGKRSYDDEARYQWCYSSSEEDCSHKCEMIITDAKTIVNNFVSLLPWVTIPFAFFISGLASLCYIGRKKLPKPTIFYKDNTTADDTNKLGLLDGNRPIIKWSTWTTIMGKDTWAGRIEAFKVMHNNIYYTTYLSALVVSIFILAFISSDINHDIASSKLDKLDYQPPYENNCTETCLSLFTSAENYYSAVDHQSILLNLTLGILFLLLQYITVAILLKPCTKASTERAPKSQASIIIDNGKDDDHSNGIFKCC